MAIIEINRNPGKGELNWFGLIFLSFLSLVGAVLWYKADAQTAAKALWITAGVVTVLYYAIPPMRRPLYLAWMYAAFPIGWVMSHLVLGIVFYLVFTPIGLILRLAGKDPMSRKTRRDQDSYWVEHDPHNKPERYFRQF
jgi:ABC-type uncharacterized transport system permease subunit